MELSLFFDNTLAEIDALFYGSILTIIVCGAYLKRRGATLHAIKQDLLMGTATVLLVVGILALGYSVGYADTITRVGSGFIIDTH